MADTGTLRLVGGPMKTGAEGRSASAPMGPWALGWAWCTSTYNQVTRIPIQGLRNRGPARLPHTVTGLGLCGNGGLSLRLDLQAGRLPQEVRAAGRAAAQVGSQKGGPFSPRRATAQNSRKHFGFPEAPSKRKRSGKLEGKRRGRKRVKARWSRGVPMMLGQREWVTSDSLAPRGLCPASKDSGSKHSA